MSDEPLIRALAEGDAVAFVGSGASIPAGLPSWPAFLEGLLQRELAGARRQEEWLRARQILHDKDFLLAAELLQRNIPGPNFRLYVNEVISRITEPTDIHRSIARLP